MSDIPWLNKDSRTFLERGYLLPGVTPEARIRQIAEYAESILAYPGFADRFEKYMHNGWFSLSTPIWSNFGAGRGHPISCVTGDMWINTFGGGKQAKDIVVGDEVLTHKGRFKRVTNIIVTANRGDIYQLKVNNRMTPIRLTGDHLVMTNLGWIRADQLDSKLHLVAINGKVEHKEEPYVIDIESYCNYVHRISEDGLIQKTMTPKNQRRTGRVVSLNHAQVRKQIEIDNDLAWAIGLWFAEGSITINAQKEPNGIRITVGHDEQHLADRWLQIMTDKFNLHGNSYHSQVDRPDAAISKVGRWITVNLNSSVIGRYFASFGRGCKEKVLPIWVLSLPLSHLQSLLDGLLIGDGSAYSEQDCIKITLANPVLILQTYLIGLKLGREMSLQMQEKPSSMATTKYVYTILFRNYTFSRSRNRSNAGIMFHDGLVYSTINSIQLTDRHETVYDFTVEDDHSFSVAGVLVHNCFGSYVEDTMDGILSKVAEVGMESKYGGGTSAYFGSLRPRGAVIGTGGKSSGPVHFMELFDVVTQVVSQSNVRRGSFAAYLPVEHPDILEFLTIRDEDHPIQDMSIGVCIGDAWMENMIAGDKAKRKVWAKIIEKRCASGYPYLFFTDTVNKNAPQVYKDKGMRIWASNLCSEVELSASEDESFVCCLSSLNLLHYHAWENTDAVETLTYFLDAVMSDFIRLSKDITFMEAPHRFATNQRALGIGVLGWHSLLQSKMIPFESMEAKRLTGEIHHLIKIKSQLASREMGTRYGEPPLLQGYGMRNVTTMAIAPTTSSSFILGQVSPSVEPENSVYHVRDLAKGEFTYKNPYLKALLKEKGKDDRATWDSILVKGGSVQHLDCLSSHEKDVFKTFGEISQKEIIIQASIRQKYIDQGQSLNLMIPPATPPRQISELMIEGWRLGLKGFYYQRSSNPVQQLARNILACRSCEA